MAIIHHDGAIAVNGIDYTFQLFQNGHVWEIFSVEIGSGEEVNIIINTNLQYGHTKGDQAEYGNSIPVDLYYAFEYADNKLEKAEKILYWYWTTKE